MTAGEGERWSRLAPLLTPRYLHACAPLLLDPEGEVGVIVAGGYSTTYLNSTEVYWPARDRWQAGGDMATPRCIYSTQHPNFFLSDKGPQS